MCATEIFLCTHVQVVVLHEIQHCVYSGNRGYADGARGQSGVDLGVVRAVYVQQIVVDALEVEALPCKFYGGVGL